MMLGARLSFDAGGSGERNKGSARQFGLGLGVERDGSGNSEAGLDGGAAGLLKNCVKLPSPDAESDNPGDENPFPLGGFEGGMFVD